MEANTVNRREILCRTAVVPVLAFGAARIWADAGSGANNLVLIAEDHPTAAALSYVHDAEKSPKRGTEEQRNHYCDNCIHYKATAVAEPNPQDGRGTCALLPGFLVAAKGWCSVWVAKPPG